MKRITIELDDEYDDVISLTAIGNTFGGMNVSTGAFKIENGDTIIIDADGKANQKHSN